MLIYCNVNLKIYWSTILITSLTFLSFLGYQGCRGSKRKGDDDISILETPKLFASKFRVPKLKKSSPHDR